VFFGTPGSQVQDRSGGWREIHVQLEIRSMERGICPIAPLMLRLTLYSLTGSRVWPLVVTWRHWSRDHWNHTWSFPIGGLLTPRTISSSTFAEIFSLKHFGVTSHDLDPFGSRDVLGHVTIDTADGRFLLVIHWHHIPISRRCWDIKLHNLDNLIPIVNALETNFGDLGGDCAIFQ